MSALAKSVAIAGMILAASPAVAARKGLQPGERIDLNRATVSELMRVPGVGERKARAIVALRQRQPFRRVEDVLAVKGLGPAWLSKVKGSLFVGPAAPPPSQGPVAKK